MWSTTDVLLCCYMTTVNAVPMFTATAANCLRCEFSTLPPGPATTVFLFCTTLSAFHNQQNVKTTSRGKINAIWWYYDKSTKIGRYYVDMNCQQICKISRKKDLTEMKIFLKVLGATFFETPCRRRQHRRLVGETCDSEDEVLKVNLHNAYRQWATWTSPTDTCFV